MQKSVAALAERYCDRVARRLRGWVRNSTVSEIILDCTDSICSNPDLSAGDPPPAELWRRIVERFGQPHEYALKFIAGLDRMEEYQRFWRRTRQLLLLTIAVVLLACGCHFYLNSRLGASERQLTDPSERAAALALLREVFDRYRTQPQCRMNLTITSYTSGKSVDFRYRLLHRGCRTILRPANMDVAHVSFTDTATTIYHPALRAYETFSGTEQLRTLNGNSLTIGLLQDSFKPVQLTIKDCDLTEILERDTEVVYKISGVYFDWGDACFTITLNRQMRAITGFMVTKPQPSNCDETRVYAETVQECEFACAVPESATVLKLPTNVRQTTDLIKNHLLEARGWKAMSLIGKNAPDLAGTDIRTGRHVDIRSYRGRPLLLVCCSTWVPWHRLYLSALAEAYGLFRRHGIEILVLSPDVEPRHTEEYLARVPLPFPYITDYQGWNNPAFARYELFARFDYAPAFIAIDRNGKVVGVSSRYYSPIEDSLPDLLAVAAPLLGDNGRPRLAEQLREGIARRSESELLTRAEEYFTAENDFYGKVCLEEILRRRPEDLAARLRLCRLYAEYDWSQGNVLAESCLNDTDASPYPYVLLGNYYWQQKHDLDRAVREYNKARVVDPRCYLAWRQEGALYYSANRFQDASRVLNKALSSFPEDNVTLWLLGQALADSNLWDDGIPILRRALTSLWHMRGADDEHVFHLHRLLAALLNKTKHSGQAIAELRIALKYDPYYDGTLLTLGKILLRRKNGLREALEIARRLAEGNQIGEHYLLYGRALLRNGRPHEAEMVLREAAELDPSLPGLPRLLERAGTMASAAGNPATARP